MADDNEATHNDLDGNTGRQIVQSRVFADYDRYDDFNEFTKNNNIGNEDIISIADDEDRIVLFYLKQ